MNENQLLAAILAEIKRVFGPTSVPVASSASNLNQLLYEILEQWRRIAGV